MKNLYKYNLVLFLLLAHTPGALSQTLPNKLDVITNNLPYRTQTSINRHSFVSDILKQIFNEQTTKVNTTIAPYLRGQRTIESKGGECFAFFPLGMKELLYSQQPWVVHQIDMIHRSDGEQSQPVGSVEQLYQLISKQQKRIAVIAGMDYGKEPNSLVQRLKSTALVVNVYGENAYQQSLEMLNRGRVDMILSCPVWQHATQGTLTSPAETITSLYHFPDTVLDLHFACSKDFPFAEVVINKVNEALPRLYEEGILQQIFAKHNQEINPRLGKSSVLPSKKHR